MSVSAQLVKELREKTGVGIMDCKKALEQSNGDFDKAITYLREKGMATATKKSDRSTNEGRVFAALSADHTQGVLLELNCETDFVSGNEAFLGLGTSLAAHILNHSIATLESLQASTIEGQSFEAYLSESVLKLGEKISVKLLTFIHTKGSIGTYTHMNGKIGVLVEFNVPVSEEVGKDIAMHIAASAPQYVQSSEVPESEIDKEKEIIKNQSLNEGKPEAVIEKIISGRINKFFKDICLIDQAFVKNPDMTVKQVLAGASVVRFCRYMLG